jgi:hypothetical protein
VLIYAPESGDLSAIADFSVELGKVDRLDELVVDFGRVRFVTPAWCVLVGGLLLQFRKTFPSTRAKIIDFKRLGYAAHMGFFQYFGVPHGQKPDAASGSNTYFSAENERHSTIGNITVNGDRGCINTQ